MRKSAQWYQISIWPPMNVVQIPNSSRCTPDRQNPVKQTNCAVGMAETIRPRMRYRYQALPRSFRLKNKRGHFLRFASSVAHPASSLYHIAQSSTSSVLMNASFRSRRNNILRYSEEWFELYALNDDPQPQVCVAFGFLKTNPRPITSSLKSISVPLRYR